MRYVTIPEPIPMIDLVTRKPLKLGGEGGDADGDEQAWSMHKFLVRAVLPDSAIGKDYKADRARMAIDKEARTANGVMALEEDHWERLKKAIEKPEGSMAHPAMIRAQCLPFQIAIVEATEKDPRNPEPAPTPKAKE